MLIRDILKIMPEPLAENHRLWELGLVESPSHFVRWTLLDKMVIPPALARNVHGLFMNPNGISDANGVKFVQVDFCDSSTPNRSSMRPVNLRHLPERERAELSALLFNWYLGEVDRAVVLARVAGIVHRLRPFTEPMWYFMDEPGRESWIELPPAQ